VPSLKMRFSLRNQPGSIVEYGSIQVRAPEVRKLERPGTVRSKYSPIMLITVKDREVGYNETINTRATGWSKGD